MRRLLARRALDQLVDDLVRAERGTRQLRAHLACASGAVASRALRRVNRRAMFGGESHSCHECKNCHTRDETFHGILSLLIIFGFATNLHQRESGCETSAKVLAFAHRRVHRPASTTPVSIYRAGDGGLSDRRHRGLGIWATRL